MRSSLVIATEQPVRSKQPVVRREELVSVFQTTRWSRISAARGDGSQARKALEELCRTYWQPLYLFIRRTGRGHEDARDLTQDFFTRLLEGELWRRADRSRGRFRSFLLACLKNFLANEWEHAGAQKRGARTIHLNIDALHNENTDAVLRDQRATPDETFDREWALTLMRSALERLEHEYRETGKGEHFEILKPTLTLDGALCPYSTLARQLGLSEDAVKVAVHRLRRRYQKAIRYQIADTVRTPEEAKAELQDLIAILNS
ncbi:MAG: sigma-70 family RNA polymerase sigma factor [Candidatus Hydrogenedentes bacterium]|nr:sigma-70 family RNA polymerase sigma factor [Candidatus Hydrogenedentota bacterium]